MHFDLLLMTSRSGSSMVAEIIVRHGFHWASPAAQKRNPVVGSNKVRYRSFENQVVKDFNKKNFGTPLGEMITFNDLQADRFEALLQQEYSADIPNVWKGAIEFFPLWLEMEERGIVKLNPMIVYRSKEKVIDSVLAKRNGKGGLAEATAITDKRYEMMDDFASEYAMPYIETEQLIAGDY